MLLMVQKIQNIEELKPDYYGFILVCQNLTVLTKIKIHKDDAASIPLTIVKNCFFFVFFH